MPVPFASFLFKMIRPMKAPAAAPTPDSSMNSPVLVMPNFFLIMK